MNGSGRVDQELDGHRGRISRQRRVRPADTHRQVIGVNEQLDDAGRKVRREIHEACLERDCLWTSRNEPGVELVHPVCVRGRNSLPPPHRHMITVGSDDAVIWSIEIFRSMHPQPPVVLDRGHAYRDRFGFVEVFVDPPDNEEYRMTE